MNAEEAEDIYWEAYGDSLKRFQLSLDRTNQRQVYLDAIQAVLDAHRQELDKEWAERYLAMQESSKTINWQLKEGYLSPTPLYTET